MSLMCRYETENSFFVEFFIKENEVREMRGKVKKGIVLALACLMVFVLTACESGEHINLTQEESDAIAQYSAYLIMKYDTRKTHKEKLLDEKQLKKAYEERAAEEAEKNPVKKDPTPVPTEAPEKVTPTAEVTPEITEPAEVTPTAEPAKPAFESLSECYDNKFEVLFSKSIVGESYKGDNEYLSVYAPDGQKLVVTEFIIRNGSSQDLNFKTSDFKVEYKLISDKKTYKPKMSLITNDLLLLEKKLTPGESTSGILVYFIDNDEIPKSVVVTNTDLSPDKIYEITINN